MSLSLHATSAVVRRDGNPYEPDDDLYAYQRDLLAPFGIEVDVDLLKRSTNIGFGELADAALAAAPALPGPDLLLLAYAIPDMYPLKTVTAHLNHVLGGRSRSFAVSEQGLRAPFTALRIAAAYARSGRCADLALFVCEQTTLPYHDPLVHDEETPLVDSAALLYFAGGGGTLRLGEVRRRGPDAPLTDLLTADAGDPGTLVVVGPWVDRARVDRLDAPVHRVAPGSYCTSVWLDLARHHRDWAERYRSVVLCDTDPRTGVSQSVTFHSEQ